MRAVSDTDLDASSALLGAAGIISFIVIATIFIVSVLGGSQ